MGKINELFCEYKNYLTHLNRVKYKLVKIENNHAKFRYIGLLKVFQIPLERVVFNELLILSIESRDAFELGRVTGLKKFHSKDGILGKIGGEEYKLRHSFGFYSIDSWCSSGCVTFLSIHGERLQKSIQEIRHGDEIIGFIDPTQAFYLGFLVGNLSPRRKEIRKTKQKPHLRIVH